MKKTNIRKLYYHLKHRYATRDNLIIIAALLVAASWAWGSIGVMQRNYRLQQEVDAKMRQEKLVDLEVQNAQFEQKYYQSEEYQELEVRARLGLAYPGEKVLILPPNTPAVKHTDREVFTQPRQRSEPASRFEQWMNFLFGGNRQHLQD